MVAVLCGNAYADVIMTAITDDTEFKADAEYSVSGSAVVKGNNTNDLVKLNLNGFNAAFSSTNAGNDGAVSNGEVFGKGTESLTITVDANPGLGTGTNTIRDLAKLTINASATGITGYGMSTINSVKEVFIYSDNDGIQAQGDGGGSLTILGFDKLEILGQNGYGIQDASSQEGHSIQITGTDGSSVRIASQDSLRSAIRSQGAQGSICIAAGEVSVESQNSDSELLSTYKGTVNVSNGSVSIEAQKQLSVSNSMGSGIANSGGKLEMAGEAISIQGEQNGVVLSGSGTTTFTADTLDISAGNGTAVAGNAKDFSGSLTFSGREDARMQARLEGDVAVSGGTVTMNRVDAYLKAGSTFSTASLTGEGSTLYLQGFAEGDTPTVSIDRMSASDFSVMASGNLNDQYANPQDLAQALQKAVSAPTEGKNAISFGAEAGSTSDGFTVNADGTLDISANASLAAVGSFSTMTLSQWRSEINHLSERLGDVRADSHAVGAWARVYGYESTATDAVKVKMKASSVQAGADVRLSPNWLVGAAFSYTDLDADFSNGDGSSDGYSLAAYASGFFDCGGYLDVIGRIGRLSSSVTAATGTAAGGVLRGDYDNTALGLSAEAGYHWKLTDVFYLEPQAELSYGIVLGDDFTSKSNGVKISQDDFETLVGRLGIRAGSVFADGRGQVYAHASVHHDFLGNADSSAAPSVGAARRIDVDLGGTWTSFGVGAQFVLENSMTFYGMIERANSSEYDEDYRYSVGMRYAF